MDDATADVGESCKAEFYAFLTEFGKDDEDRPAEERHLSKYQTFCLETLRADPDTKMFRVDFSDVDDFNADLAEIVVDSFLRIEPYLNQALRRMVMEVNHQSVDDCVVAFYNLRQVESLRGLRGDHIGQLTAFAGRVTRTGEVRPELYLATFTCGLCGSTVRHVEQEFKLTMPKACSNRACQNK